ncbi:hypothetical protein F751_4543 [Auxenochlorella protothecoides]|uniref:TF-B3 domain-containing protein n=2 Tax=Auxenochlorella protothecoides TaxID=3075 RepID=A0A087SNG9_AUXPR|nr:hypothetical protein F751_4543 [Auxenochlorella protothecoides]KFM27273.1 hypothetical protein F751_4543 [Auxenochlorella protothecoides]
MAPSNYTVLCSKALTHSDVTTEIAKSGRLVLPRAQVFMYDMSGKMWRFQMKTWHNVVACGGRATYVLENTAGFVQEFGLQPGAWLAICEQEGRLAWAASAPMSHSDAGMALWTLTRVPSGPAPASEERTGAELARALRMV